MVKRPLVWILSAYIAGILLSLSHNISVGHIFFLSIVFYGIIMVYHLFHGFSGLSREMFWPALPFFLYLGFSLYKTQTASGILDAHIVQKIEAQVEGTLYKIENKAGGQVLYMKDTRVIFEGKKYSCGRILVYPDYNPGLKIGNQILVKGDLVKFLPASNPGQFDELQYYKTKWICYKAIDREVCHDRRVRGFFKF